jgi:hypothetical protein
MSFQLPTLVTVVLLVAGAIALCALVALLPLRLPWPVRLRWIVASNSLAAAEPLGRPLSAHSLDMREVWLAIDERHGDQAWIWIGSPGAASWTHYVLRGDEQSMATIERWSAGRTPLLCVAHGSGELSLYASGEAVCGIRPAGPDLVRAA